MPLTPLLTDAVAKVHDVIPQVSAIHFTAATVKEALYAGLIFPTPETILSQAGWVFLQTPSVVENITAMFVDEFHIVKAWCVKWIFIDVLLPLYKAKCSEILQKF